VIALPTKVEQTVADRAYRHNIQPMLLVVTVLMMVAICLASTVLGTRLGLGRWQSSGPDRSLYGVPSGNLDSVSLIVACQRFLSYDLSLWRSRIGLLTCENVRPPRIFGMLASVGRICHPATAFVRFGPLTTTGFAPTTTAILSRFVRVEFVRRFGLLALRTNFHAASDLSITVTDWRA
jgi:hypothetical protein